MGSINSKLLPTILAIVAIATLAITANAQSMKTKAAFARADEAQQPLYTEYKGVRLGMSASDVRAKLGSPALKGTDQDYFVISENESAQIGYDSAQKVNIISVDYSNGIGAPEAAAVVGAGELERTANGSLYKVVRYESLGFWVSYNRTTGLLPIVTITLQKSRIVGR